MARSFRKISLPQAWPFWVVASLAFWVCLAPAVCAVVMPPSLPAEVTITDAKTGKETVITGELYFETWPVTVDGKPSAIAKEKLVPTVLNPALFVREEKGPGFVLKGGKDLKLEFAFKQIPIRLKDDSDLSRAIEQGTHTALGVNDLEDPEKAAQKPPVEFGVDQRLDLKVIEVSSIRKIQFKTIAAVAFDINGRYVGFNQRSVGSGGAIKLLSATRLGGSGNDEIIGGAFLPDGSIGLVIGTTDPFSWTINCPVPKGEAPRPVPASALTTAPTKPDWKDPCTTMMVVVLNADATKVVSSWRLPWGAGRPTDFQQGPGGACYIGGDAGASMPEAAKAFARVPEVPAPVAKKGATPRGDSFLVRLKPDFTGLEWLVLFRGQGFDFGIQPGDKVLARSGRTLWNVSPQGEVERGPITDPGTHDGRGRFSVSPLDGAFYMGGDYNSATGFEPYRNPYLHRFEPDGKVAWTAWNWTGPMVGTYFRQVSDSSCREIRFARNGDLVMTGWSDGGNTVFTNLPYDLTKGHGLYGAFNDMSAANVGSFCHLLRLDAKTMEVRPCTMVLAYHPITNKPNSVSVRDVRELADGSWMVAGYSAYGLIETHDAWFPAWYPQWKKDPKSVSPRGGPFVMVFDSQFKKLRFSSQLPAAQPKSLAVKGSRALLVGAAGARETAYGQDSDTLIRNAIQATHAGGATDGYVMLIDTGEAK